MNESTPKLNGEVSFPISLSKYLSTSGVTSRRKATELIKDGQVKVNGSTNTEPGIKLLETDTVEFDGKTVTFGKRYYVILNKPRGYVCTSEDAHAKKKAIDLVIIPNARLFTAGRLDKDSEGLIIITNDGEYAAKLTHPRYQTQKIYRVSVDQTLSKETLEDFCTGIEDDGDILKAKSVTIEGGNIYIFTLTEGKNREIRRMIDSVNRKTVRLKRIATGKLSLDKLKTGEWRHLTDEEVNLTLNS